MSNLKEVLNYIFYDKISDIPKLDWIENFFLTANYLGILEKANPIGMKFKYLTIKDNDDIVAFFYFQIIPFNASNSLQAKQKPISHKDTFNYCVKSFFSNFIQFKTIVVGNLTLTGPNGFEFNPKFDLYKNDQFINQTIERAILHINQSGENISLILLKDFPFVNKKNDFYYHKKYFPFCIDPDMNFKLNNSWNNVEDYTADFTTKYRTRYNRARKKLGSIQKKELSLEEIQFYSNEIYTLYLKIAEKADFNTVTLSSNYFLELKKQLNSNCKIIGYFLDNRLVSFVSLITIDKELEAHYIGYEPTINAQHQLYLNMLYDIVDFGITHKVHNIGFARTASEIKSSVGATANQYYCYLKHTKPIINKCIPALFQYFTPVENWEPRNPFKKVD